MDKEQEGVQKYPLSIRTRVGELSKCGTFGVLKSIQTKFVQVWEVHGPPWCNWTKSVQGYLVSWENVGEL